MFGSDLKIFIEIKNCRGKIKNGVFNSFGVSREGGACGKDVVVDSWRTVVESAVKSQRRLLKI